MARRLADGVLCSDSEFDCYRSDAPNLMDTLRTVCTPGSVTDWRRGPDRVSGFVAYPTWRAHGSTSSGGRLFIEVIDVERERPV